MTEKERARQKAQDRINKRREESEKNKTADNLRAPVVVVLGHVDTGQVPRVRDEKQPLLDNEICLLPVFAVMFTFTSTTSF